MTRIDRDVLLIAAAAATAVAVPVLLLWPAEPLIDLPAQITPTPLRLRTVEPLGPALETALFDQDRSPADLPPEPGPEQTAGPEGSPPPSLVGTVGSTSGAGIALLRTAAGQTVALRVGGEVDGWRLKTVQQGRVVMIQKERAETLRLTFTGKRATASEADASEALMPGASDPSPPAATTQQPLFGETGP